MKVYAVYSIPKSPEYRLEKLFKTKEMAKEFVRLSKEVWMDVYDKVPEIIFDIQIEEIEE